jgi:hypothetical protein
MGLVIVHNQPSLAPGLGISCVARCTSRKVYDETDGWGDDDLFRMPVFVVTHETHNPVSKGCHHFEVCHGGFGVALEHRAEGDHALRQ